MKNKYDLLSCLWELTLKCNLNCMHCGSAAGKARQKELSLEKCYSIADEIIGLKCKELTFIGGEIFLFDGWEKIARKLTKNGVTVNIISNGFRIGENEIEKIKYANLSNVGISLDGTGEVHNKIRNNKHSFDRIIHSFELLNRAKIPIAVVTSLLDMNYKKLEDLYKLLIKYNISTWQIQLVNPMGNMADKKEILFKRKNLPKLINFIREKNKDKLMNIAAADNIGYYYKDSESYIRGTASPFCYWEGCSAGVNSVFIDSIGNIKGCGSLYDDKFIEGNLMQNSLPDIWNDNKKFSYNRKFKTEKLTGICKECDVSSICKGGCRSSNYFMTNSLYQNAFCMHLKQI